MEAGIYHITRRFTGRLKYFIYSWCNFRSSFLYSRCIKLFNVACYSFSGMALFFLVDNNLDNQYKKRRFQLERDFPNFISKLILLVNAGLNVRQAIERIVADSNKEEPLYKELQCVISDIKAGVLEYEAYMDFQSDAKLSR